MTQNTEPLVCKVADKPQSIHLFGNQYNYNKKPGTKQTSKYDC